MNPILRLLSESLPVRIAFAVVFMALWLIAHWLLGD